MTLDERMNYIHDFIEAVTLDIVEKADMMPGYWDDEELRRYIADCFERECGLLARGRVRSSGSTKRMGAYTKQVAKWGL